MKPKPCSMYLRGTLGAARMIHRSPRAKGSCKLGLKACVGVILG